MVAGGMRVRVVRCSMDGEEEVVAVAVVMVGELVMGEGVKPKALGLGERRVAGEMAGLAGLAGRGWSMCHATGRGNEM